MSPYHEKPAYYEMFHRASELESWVFVNMAMNLRVP
jgi:hypothetical protein